MADRPQHKIPRIYEPVWVNSPVSYATCTACRAQIDRTMRYLIDRYHHASEHEQPRLCESCGLQAIAAGRERRIKLNQEIQKYENCPQCHVPYPLSQVRTATSQAVIAAQALAALAFTRVPCCEQWDDGHLDRVWLCGCRAHDGHISEPFVFCAAHKPHGDVSFGGCCYVCEYPLTVAARIYSRNLWKSDPNNCVSRSDLVAGEDTHGTTITDSLSAHDSGVSDELPVHAGQSRGK